ncbi:MAG: cupin domain-containing protein [Eubacterium sp.]|jgi:quercetin dioxygenase-like cupin family protein
MYKKCEEIKPVILEHMKGGKKYVQKFSSIGTDDFTENADVVARLVLIPGASIGYHEHVGNEEVITVLSGSGRCTDDGEVYSLHPGDVTICREHHQHGIENFSETEDLVLMAVVIRTQD